MLKEATIHFCLFDESYMAMECIEMYWLCKYNKKVRRGQAAISMKSYTEL